MPKNNRMKNYKFNLGDYVRKRSGRPFKSGNKIGTIREFTINPHTGNPAVYFREDDSVVDLMTLEPLHVGYCKNCGTFASTTKLVAENDHHDYVFQFKRLCRNQLFFYNHLTAMSLIP